MSLPESQSEAHKHRTQNYVPPNEVKFTMCAKQAKMTSHTKRQKITQRGEKPINRNRSRNYADGNMKRRGQ